jgi:uncharacterized protein (DUF924 family)
MSTLEQVLSYWFPAGHDVDEESYRRQVRWWFAGGPEVDRQISERFGETLERARLGELDFWADTPRGRLALIIVLDQFSRNVYRGSPDAYAQDSRAEALTLSGLDAGMEKTFSLPERFFFLLPLGHSEDLALQDRGMPYMEQMVEQAPAHLGKVYDFLVGQAHAHREAIIRFGRHPQRNLILGRTSTSDEIDYIKMLPVHLRPTSREPISERP